MEVASVRLWSDRPPGSHACSTVARLQLSLFDCGKFRSAACVIGLGCN